MACSHPSTREQGAFSPSSVRVAHELFNPPAVGFPKPRAYRQTRSFQAQRDPQSDGAAAPRDMMVPEKWGLWLGAALRSESPFSVVPLFPGWEWSKVHCESHP